jgi:hypothetical protein
VGWTEGKRTKYAVRKRVESPSLPHLDFLILPLSPPPLTLPLALSRVVLLLLLLLDLSLVFEELGGLEEGLKLVEEGHGRDSGGFVDGEDGRQGTGGGFRHLVGLSKLV